MIAKIVMGDSFRAIAFYICRESKDARILAAAGVRTDSPEHLAEDFTFQRQLQPELGLAVLHIPLSLRAQDAVGRSPEEVSELLVQASRAYLLELEKEQNSGPLRTQWVLVQHFDKNHPHAHLVLNRVDDEGEIMPDIFIGQHSRRACQRVEQQLGLATAEEQGREQAQRPGPTNRQLAATTPREVRRADWQRARHTVANALLPAKTGSESFAELADKLAPQHIQQVVSEHRRVDGSVGYGVRFEYDGYRFKGGEVGPGFTAPQLLAGFAQVAVERRTQVVAAVNEFNNLFETGRLNALLKEGEKAAQQHAAASRMVASAQLPRIPRVARSLPEQNKSEELEM